MSKKPKKKKRPYNEIRLRFIPDELFKKISSGATTNKRTNPDEVLFHLENTYK